MHDLLRLFARERAEAEDSEHERSSAVERSIHFLIATLRQASRVTIPVPRTERLAAFHPRWPQFPGLSLKDRGEVFAWLDTDVDAVLELTLQATRMRADGPHLAVGLAAGALTPLWHRGQFATLLRLGRLAVASAEITREPRDRALGYCILGVAQVNFRNSYEAVDAFEQAAIHYRSIGEESDEAYQLAMLGIAHSRLGRHEEAIGSIQRSIRLSRECKDPACELFCLNGFGAALRRAGELERALDAHLDALDLCAPVGLTAAYTLGEIADVHRALGRLGDAIETYERSLAKAEEFGEEQIFSSGTLRCKLAQTYSDVGQYERARENWRRSADILQALNLITSEEKAGIYQAAHPESLEVIERLMPDLSP